MNLSTVTDQAPDSGLRRKEEEGLPNSRRGDFGFGALRELRRLRAESDAARAAAEAVPGDDRLRLRADTARIRLEVFGLEHDQAGAFKFNRFGSDIAKMFETGPGREPGILIDAKTGRLSLAESEKGRRLLFVNMGELDRVNKEGGGHAAGDAALRETAHAVEAAVLSTLGQDAAGAEYTMVRYSGNEFMLSLKGVSAEQADAIAAAVKSHWDDLPAAARREKLAEIGIDEPTPYTANHFEFQEALDLMSEMQLELLPEERVRQDEPGAAASELIEVLRLRANYGLDVDKFHDRVKRVQALGPEKARPLFDTYLKKMFDADLADVEAVAALTAEEAERRAFDYAAKYLDGAASRDAAKEAIIARRTAELQAARGAPQSGPARREPAPPGTARIADIPARTEGQKLIDAANVAALSAAESGDADARAHAEALRDREVKSRDAGTGLLTRNRHYADLQSSFREGRASAMLFIDMGFLKLFDKSGGSDVGDNALKMAASVIEKALASSGLEGRSYRYAGDEFTVQLDGDIASAEAFRAALDAAVREAGAIPAGRNGSREGYQPTELVFNMGAADTAITEAVYADLVAAGVYDERDLADPSRVLNEKANLMTVIADKAIEKDKAVDRFALLVDGLNDPAYRTDNRRGLQVDGIRKYSGKAIFAERGGNEFLDALVATGLPSAELRPRIAQWVEARMAEAPEQKSRKLELTNRLIEMHGKIRYYERALRESRHAEAVTSMHEQRLRAELDAVKRERQALIDVRKSLE